MACTCDKCSCDCCVCDDCDCARKAFLSAKHKNTYEEEE